MEEKKQNTAFTLSFASRQLQQLEATLCDPQDQTLKTVLLSNYNACCFTLSLTLSHCYLVLSPKSQPSNHVIQLELPSEEHKVVQKQTCFELFDFRIRASLEPVSEAPTERHREWSADQLAGEAWEMIRGRAMRRLEREGFFEREKDANKLIKICVRKPKGKKNMTEVFRLHKNGQIKSILHNSTLFLEDKTIDEASQDQDQPPLPKLQKMNTSIDKFTFGKDGKQIRNGECGKDGKKIGYGFSPTVNSLHQCPTVPSFRLNKSSFRQKITRKQYIKTLERQTQADLSLQNQILSYVQQCHWTEVGKFEEPARKRGLEKKAGTRNSRGRTAKRREGDSGGLRSAYLRS